MAWIPECRNSMYCSNLLKYNLLSISVDEPDLSKATHKEHYQSHPECDLATKLLSQVGREHLGGKLLGTTIYKYPYAGAHVDNSCRRYSIQTNVSCAEGRRSVPIATWTNLMPLVTDFEAHRNCAILDQRQINTSTVPESRYQAAHPYSSQNNAGTKNASLRPALTPQVRWE